MTVYLKIVLIKLQTKKWQIILMKIFLNIRYYKSCIAKELIIEKELILLKVIEVKGGWFATISFLDHGFKFRDSV